MNHNPSGTGRLPATFMTTGSSSFTEFIGAHSPELLPSRRQLPKGGTVQAPHGTTIVSLTYDGGVIMAGDRRATMGNLIANRDMNKVFGADEYSDVGIAGTAGIAIEIIKLFPGALDHYGKRQGPLVTDGGKDNRQATTRQANGALARRGRGGRVGTRGRDRHRARHARGRAATPTRSARRAPAPARPRYRQPHRPTRRGCLGPQRPRPVRNARRTPA